MQVQQKVERLIKIWDERRVFGTSSTQSFRELVTGAGAAGTPKKAAGTYFCSFGNVACKLLLGMQNVRC